MNIPSRHGNRYAVNLLLLSCLIFITGCWSITDTNCEGTLDQCFQMKLDQLQQEYEFPGATAAFVLPDNSVHGFATGFADTDHNITMTPETFLLSGSIGKTHVAALLLSLSQDGTLDLDDKISKWLGDYEWFNRLPNADGITVKMLLNHSTGLENYVNLPEFVRYFSGEVQRNPDFNPPKKDVIEFILDREPYFEAGKGFKYSETNYILAGLVIESATQSTYYDELARRLLLPLELNHTIPSNHRSITDLAVGYLEKDNYFGLPTQTINSGLLVFNPAVEWTGGGVAATSTDLARWAKLLYEGNGLPKPYLDELLNGIPTSTDDPGRRYGLGVDIRETPYGIVYGHSGSIPGYQSLMVYFSNCGISIAIQVNRDTDENVPNYLFALADTLFESDAGGLSACVSK